MATGDSGARTFFEGVKDVVTKMVVPMGGAVVGTAADVAKVGTKTGAGAGRIGLDVADKTLGTTGKVLSGASTGIGNFAKSHQYTTTFVGGYLLWRFIKKHLSRKHDNHEAAAQQVPQNFGAPMGGGYSPAGAPFGYAPQAQAPAMAAPMGFPQQAAPAPQAAAPSGPSINPADIQQLMALLGQSKPGGPEVAAEHGGKEEWLDRLKEGVKSGVDTMLHPGEGHGRS